MPKLGKGSAAKEIKEEIREIDRSQLDEQGNFALQEAERKAEEIEALVGGIGNESMSNLMNTEVDDDKLDMVLGTMKKVREKAEQEKNNPPQQKEEEEDELPDVEDEGTINAMPPQQSNAGQGPVNDDRQFEGEESEIIENDWDAMDPVKDLSNPFPNREPQPNLAEPQQQDGAELLQIDRPQKAAAGKRFKAVKTEYKSIGVGGWTARVLGHALFGVFTALQTAYYAVKNGIKSAHRKRIRWKEEKKLTAEEREQREAEALNAADRAKEPTELDRINEGADDQEISTNYSKKPLLWEKYIAEDPEQKPYLSVDIEKVPGEEQNLGDDMSHASLTLNYTRFDRLTWKQERCRVKMGYYFGGGMGGTAIPATMLGKGTYISGQLKDDSKLATTMGKRYEVNNKQINHILEEASTYEGGGFHYLKRNCCTFVADVTQHAGVPTGDILKEADLNIGVGWVIAPLVPLLAPLFDSKARKAIDRANSKTNRNFGQEGEKLLSDEIRQQHYDASDNTMRWSLRSPTATGERIRRSQGGILHAGGYKVAKGKTTYTTLEKKVEVVLPQLLDSIRQVTQNTVREGDESFEPAIKELEDKIRTALPPIVENWKQVRDKNEYGHDTSYVNDLCRKSVTELQALQEYVSNWYYTVVDGDERLNDPFLRFVSVLEDGQETFNSNYIATGIAENRRDVAGLLQEFRVTSAFSYDAATWSPDGLTKQEEYQRKNTSFKGEELISLIKTHGSLRKALDIMDNVRAVNAHAKMISDKTMQFKDEEEKKRIVEAQGAIRDKVSQKEAYFTDARTSIKGDLSRTGMTEEDVHFAFVALPKEFEGMEMDTRRSGVALYQALAYEKVFGGLRAETEQAYKDAGGDSHIFAEKISTFLYERMKNERADEMELIISVFDEKNAGASAQERYLDFINNFCEVYLREAMGLGLGSLIAPKTAKEMMDKYFSELRGTAVLETDQSRMFREELLSRFGRHIA